MTKEEQLKIYSAYFPYNLEIFHINSDLYDYKVSTTILTGILEDCLTFKNASDYYYGDEEIVVKPILYDLSYLTKEIEHEGETFVPIEELKMYDPENAIYLKEQIITGFIEQILWQQLIKWHFNVFNLSEDQFINKATLKR